MTKPYILLLVQAFFAVGFASRKGQLLESLASRDLWDMVCYVRAAAVSRSGRSLPTTRRSQVRYFMAWSPACPVSLSFSTPQKPTPLPSGWLEDMVWSRSSRLHACTQSDPSLRGSIAVSV